MGNLNMCDQIGSLANTLNWPANWNACLVVRRFCAGVACLFWCECNGSVIIIV